MNSFETIMSYDSVVYKSTWLPDFLPGFSDVYSWPKKDRACGTWERLLWTLHIGGAIRPGHRGPLAGGEYGGVAVGLTTQSDQWLWQRGFIKALGGRGQQPDVTLRFPSSAAWGKDAWLRQCWSDTSNLTQSAISKPNTKPQISLTCNSLSSILFCFLQTKLTSVKFLFKLPSNLISQELQVTLC